MYLNHFYTFQVKLFELQKAYNIYKEIFTLQAELLDFFALDQMHEQIMIFLSKLAFAAHSLQPENIELIEIARTDLINEMNVSILYFTFYKQLKLKLFYKYLFY